MSSSRKVKSPVGPELSCKGWHQEAAYRMIQNNLDPDNAEDPDNLIVYGGLGKAARNWECYDAILKSLLELENDEIQYAIIRFPKDLDRFVKLPFDNLGQNIILIDDIIRYHLKDIFKTMQKL